MTRYFRSVLRDINSSGGRPEIGVAASSRIMAMRSAKRARKDRGYLEYTQLDVRHFMSILLHIMVITKRQKAVQLHHSELLVPDRPGEPREESIMFNIVSQLFGSSSPFSYIQYLS
jgi:hypothetical protein